MKTNRFSLKSGFRLGPGGWNCSCCRIAPQNRKLFSRLHKKQMYRELNKELQKELDQQE